MSYHIEAWLDKGEPCLEIVDADSSHVRLAWRAGTEHSDRPAMHRLFRELMLISTGDEIKPQSTDPTCSPLQPFSL